MVNWLVEYQQQFSHLLKQQKLPHAILLQGLAGSGKQALATWLTQLLHCQSPHYHQSEKVYSACQQCKHCLLYQQKNYPDHQVIKSDKNTIGVDEIRQISHFLEKKAQLGLNKTVIVADAQKMTIAAANALLKTLEEPTNNSTIILLTADAASLLPTVISRCRVLTITPPVGRELLTNKEQSVDLYINISQLPELNDKAIAQEFVHFTQTFIKYFRYQQDFDTLVTLLAENPHGYRWFEKILTNLLRFHSGWEINQSLFTPDELAWLTALAQEKWWKTYQLLLNTNKQIKQLNQVNKQFISEKLLLDCASIMQEK